MPWLPARACADARRGCRRPAKTARNGRMRRSWSRWGGSRGADRVRVFQPGSVVGVGWVRSLDTVVAIVRRILPLCAGGVLLPL